MRLYRERLRQERMREREKHEILEREKKWEKEGGHRERSTRTHSDRDRFRDRLGQMGREKR